MGLVVTRVPKPAGRGSALKRTDVAVAAGRLGLSLAEVESVGAPEVVRHIRDTAPDVLVVVAYGEILSTEVLGVAAPVNVHFSLLPRWRGAAPVQRALLAGDETTGVTTMLMDAGVDTGPILLQRRHVIAADDETGTLGARLAEIGGELLVETLPMLDRLIPRPQDVAFATYAPKLSPEERLIDWTEPSDRIARLVRALAPDPGASSRVRGRAIKILRAEVAEGDAEPGTVIASHSNELVVATGEGAIRLLAVAPAGRKKMTAEEYLRGARLKAGERLG